MNKSQLVFRYCLFAVIATLANLAVQRLVLSEAYSEWQLILAIFLGTCIGLIIKYVLDKFWIFADVTTGIGQTGKQFVLYGSTGVVTTCIFWSAEYLSWLLWGTELARELGAVVGLSVGYLCKYQLDRKFVFNNI